MISRDDLENIALLSKLYIDEDEVLSITKEIGEMVKFADEINSLDIDFNEEESCVFGELREDIVKPSFSKDEILKNAQLTENGYFLVRKQA